MGEWRDQSRLLYILSPPPPPAFVHVPSKSIKVEKIRVGCTVGSMTDGWDIGSDTVQGRMLCSSVLDS